MIIFHFFDLNPNPMGLLNKSLKLGIASLKEPIPKPHLPIGELWPSPALCLTEWTVAILPACRNLYRDKILKGVKPSDLRVEQSTKLEFIINLKAAQQNQPNDSTQCAG